MRWDARPRPILDGHTPPPLLPVGKAKCFPLCIWDKLLPAYTDKLISIGFASAVEPISPSTASTENLKV